MVFTDSRSNCLWLFMASSQMPLWVLIPAKPAWLAKQRLSSVLSAQERADFTRWLLTTLLATVYASEVPLSPLLLTSDPTLADLATPYGYTTLPDPPNADLNAVLEQGRTYAIEQGAQSLLVLPTDIPYLTPAALRAFITYGEGSTPSLLIAPDREGLGTNALLLRPADAIPFRFGIESATRHRTEAQKSGIPVLEYRDPAFAQDIDVPEHYREMETLLCRG
jgi:2-phospho-L-lactate guanylyltransferase